MIDKNRGAAASKIAQQAGGTASRAIELVGYDDEVKSAMEYVFGNGLICDCLDTARAVANHPNVMKKCVTLDGDVVDPAGTMTGGSNSGLGSCLKKLQQLDASNEELESCEDRLKEVVGSLKKSAKEAASYQELSDAVELKKQQVVLLKDRLSHTTAASLAEKLEESETALKNAEKACIDAKADGKAAKQKVKDLGSQEASLRKQREKRLEALELETKQTKKQLVDAEKKLSAAEKKVKVLGMELVKLCDEVSSSEGSLAALQEEVENAKELVQEHNDRAIEKRKEYDEAKATLDDLGEQITACDNEAKGLLKEKDKASKKLNEVQLEAKKMEGKITRFNKDQAANQKFVQDMENKYAWIATEKKYFGVVHTDYDFEARDPKVVASELSALSKMQSDLNKKINKKVMNMLDKAEVEYEELTSKRKMVEADKLKIEKVISELDIKKNQALQTTWIKVNQDFGSIFSTLLPGTQAKLEPAERSVLEGLEVKVAFGSVWKESLSELSGGQRSLLALSLILALLRFKPAPMYILDEVDAALDLSHTQNIGAMLRTHFSNSQFIVVSLKEGMFNNANVIFTTKFIDGSSTVNRSTNATAVAALKAQDKARAASIKKSSSKKGSAAMSDDESEEEALVRKGPVRKRGKATGVEN
jgi:structural maintenance of chromosome 2